jgi:hypothetical protein
MNEGAREKPVVQRDLLGNIIERGIPRSVQVVPEGQITLDKFIDQLNNPGVAVALIRESESATGRGQRKRAPDYLIINKGTADEIRRTGRYYTPEVGKEAWSAPAERRDSYPKIKIEEGNIIFQVKDSDIWENGERWTHVIVLTRVGKGESPKIKGHGYMKWTDIKTK